MTQAFNLAQLANNLNTSGQLDATDGLTGLVTNANLASSGTADSTTFLRGDRTWGTVVQRIVQVASATKTDTYGTSTYNTWLDVTGLSVSITPASSSNKILVLAAVNYGGTSASTGLTLRCVRGSTPIGSASTAGNRTLGFGGTEEVGAVGYYSMFGVPFMYLDSPATTSSTTYKIQLNLNDNYGTALINQTGYDGDTVAFPRGSSTITVIEVAA